MFSTSLLLLLAAASYVHGEELTQPASMSVQPGQSLSIQCKVSYSVTSYYTAWIRQPAGKALEWIGYIDSGGSTAYSEKLKNKFSISRDTSTNTITIGGQNMQTEDTAVYYCAGAGFSFDYWGKGTMVTVTSAVQGPPQSLFPLWQCGSSKDGYVTLGCVTRDLASADGLTFTWKDSSGKSLTDFVQYPAVQANKGYTSVSHLRVKVSDWDQRKNYECEVKNSAGSKKANFLKPEVTEIKPNITISSRTTDDSVELFCWLEGFSPKKIDVQWKEGNDMFKDQPTLEIFENFQGRTKVFSALSKVSINPNKWNEGTEFTCTATQKTKTYSESWNNCKAKPTSTPQIRLEKPRLVSILTGRPVTASCFVETELIPKVLWFVDDKEITKTISTVKQQERTISNLTISTEKWKTAKTITCKASHSCFSSTEKISFSEPKKSPTVVIRRNLEDIQKGNTDVLECTATDLPSGELLVTFQANSTKVSEDQYVILPEGLDSLTRRFTVPTTNQKKDNSFSCQIQSQSGSWKSNSTGNIFGDPSVDLSVVTSVDIKGSPTQKLLCSGTGLNPTITWTKTLNIAHSKKTVEADGRVKEISEVMVPQQNWTKGETFTCQFRDQHNLKEKSISICSVNPKFVQMPQVYLLAPSIKDMRESKVSVTCLLLGHKLDAFTISWKVGDRSNSKDATKSLTKVNTNGTESLSSVLKVAITQWNNYATVDCEVQHPCSKEPKKYNISKTRGKS